MIKDEIDKKNKIHIKPARIKDLFLNKNNKENKKENKDKVIH